MMSQMKEIKILGKSFTIPTDNQTLEDAMDKQRRLISKKRKRFQIQEEAEERRRIKKRRKRSYQIQENEDNQIPRNDDEHDSSTDNLFSELIPINNPPLFFGPPRLLNLIQPLLLPWKLKKTIDDMGGYDIKMVIEKKLCKSDVNSNNNRFSIPENQILEDARDFLKPQEVQILKGSSANDDKKLQGIDVLVLDKDLRVFKLILKRWRMTSSTTYNLTHDWKNVVQRNNLKVGDMVQLWSFRRRIDEDCSRNERRHDEEEEQLGFALVKL